MHGAGQHVRSDDALVKVSDGHGGGGGARPKGDAQSASRHEERRRDGDATRRCLESSVRSQQPEEDARHVHHAHERHEHL